MRAIDVVHPEVQRSVETHKKRCKQETAVVETADICKQVPEVVTNSLLNLHHARHLRYDLNLHRICGLLLKTRKISPLCAKALGRHVAEFVTVSSQRAVKIVVELSFVHSQLVHYEDSFAQ